MTTTTSSSTQSPISPTSFSQTPSSSSSIASLTSSSTNSSTSATISTAVFETTSSVATPPPSTTSNSSSSTLKDTTSASTKTTRSSTPTATASGRKSSTGLQGGAVAGIAIGALAAGLVIAFILTYLWMRRRARHSHRRGEKNGFVTPTDRSPRGDPKGLGLGGPTVSEHAVAPRSTVSTVDAHLPASADDSTIRHSMSTLFEQIAMHVENFYHKQAVPVPKEFEGALSAFESEYLPLPIVRLLQQARSGTPIITHVLTKLMLGSISPSGDPRASFLPVECVGLPFALDQGRGKKVKKPATDEAVSRWRVLTAYLLLPSPPNPNTPIVPLSPAYSDSRDAAINNAITGFSRSFAPWINSRHSEEARVRNLTEIFKSAAEKGILLFAQPSSFLWHWGNPNEVTGGVVVTSPQLLKISDESGKALGRALIVVEKGVQKI